MMTERINVTIRAWVVGGRLSDCKRQVDVTHNCQVEY